MQDRQGESGGLAGAGLSDAEQVAASHDMRNGLGLNRCGSDVVFVSERLEERCGKAEFGESGQRVSKHAVANRLRGLDLGKDEDAVRDRLRSSGSIGGSRARHP